MDANSIYSQKIITMERGVRDKFASDKMSSAKNLACEYESEKRQLQSLNENFYNYLARVKQMEATNRNLENELKKLRERWGFDTVEVRNLKDKELDDLRAEIDDAEGSKNLRQLELRSCEYNIEMLQSAIRFLNLLAEDDLQKLRDLENQKRMLGDDVGDWHRRISDIEGELDKLRKMVQEHLMELQRAARDLEDSTFNRVKLENAVHTLKDQLRFLQAVHEEELREMENITHVDFDTGAFYKRELAKAIDDIRRDFGTLSNAQRDQMTSYYETWIEEVRNNAREEQKEIEETKQEVRSSSSLGEMLQRSASDKLNLEAENNHLQSQLKDLQTELHESQISRNQREYSMESTMANLNEEMQSLRRSLQSASEGNISLRFEIMTYRRLLEIQEKRLVDLPSTTKYMSSSDAVAYGTHSGDAMSTAGSPYAGIYESPRTFNSQHNKTCTLRHSKGDVMIEEVDADDRFIALKNVSEERYVDVGGYIVGQTDDMNAIRYEIPTGIRLKPRATLRIFSNMASRYATTDDLVATLISNWLIANRVTTIVCKPNGEQIAQLIMSASSSM